MKLPVFYDDLTQYERKQVREQYIKQQNNKCYFCKSPLSENPSKDTLKKKVNKRLFPSGFFNWPIHLHHSHNTGKTIGAVHAYCNAILWEYYNE